MSLASYRPPQQDIAAGTVLLKVRGLNLDDVALLIQAHEANLLGAYHAFENLMNGEATHQNLLSRVIMDLVIQAPAVTADIIAIACDEPDASAAARKLPFPVQVQALTTIANLTFEAGGGLGNFLAALRQIAEGTGAATPMRSSKLDSPVSGSSSTANGSPEIVSGNISSDSGKPQAS